MTEELEKILRREADKKLVKEAVKEAAREWLDEQYKSFGKWSAMGIVAGLFVLVVKLLVVNDIWPK